MFERFHKSIQVLLVAVVPDLDLTSFIAKVQPTEVHNLWLQGSGSSKQRSWDAGPDQRKVLQQYNNAVLLQFCSGSQMPLPDEAMLCLFSWPADQDYLHPSSRKTMVHTIVSQFFDVSQTGRVFPPSDVNSLSRASYLSPCEGKDSSGLPGCQGQSGTVLGCRANTFRQTGWSQQWPHLPEFLSSD